MKISEIITDLGSPVAYFPALARIFGVREALMLQQLIYWTGRQQDPHGWIYKSADEWQRELAISPKEQRTVRRNLREKWEVIEEREARLEHRLYFKIVPEKIEAAWLTRNGPTTEGDPEVPDGHPGEATESHPGRAASAGPRARDEVGAKTTRKDKTTPKRGHEGGGDPFAGVPVPATLDTAEFHAAWAEYQAARRQQRQIPLQALGINRLLKNLEPYGVATAVAALHQSVANGWRGVFPDAVAGHKAGTNRSRAGSASNYNEQAGKF